MAKLSFVVHKHDASHLHWDLRLERDGVLKSWAVPRKPPEEAGVKRLAVQVEDHELEYGKFEGTIPEGERGAGKVTIWDSGTYETVEWNDKLIIINLAGKILKGEYCLLHFQPATKNWLFFKKK